MILKVKIRVMKKKKKTDEHLIRRVERKKN